MPILNTQSNSPGVHHYIPQFYTKRWVSGDPALLTRYTRWRQDIVAVDRKSPKGVGWEQNGYSLDGFSGEEAEVVETELMKPKDSSASRMLRRLEQNGADGRWTDSDRFAWTWFMVSLLVRGPQDVESAKRNASKDFVRPNQELEDKYQELLKEFPDVRALAPPTLTDHLVSLGDDHGKRLGVKIMANMTEHMDISNSIANMTWNVIRLKNAPLLLTSDRPIRQEYPFKSKNCFITLPLGPKTMFVATHSKEIFSRLLGRGEAEFAQKNNAQVIRQARKFAFAFDDSNRAWVTKNLAKEPQVPFFDFIRGNLARP